MRRHIETVDGISEFMHFDPATGDPIGLERVADVEPVIEHNKRLATHNEGWSKSRDLVRVASIPIMVQLQWIERYGFDPLDGKHQKELRRILNDPEWRYLRTSEIIL